MNLTAAVLLSAVVQMSSKLSKAHTVGRIQGDVWGEEQEKVWKSFRYILGKMQVGDKVSKVLVAGFMPLYIKTNYFVLTRDILDMVILLYFGDFLTSLSTFCFNI